MRKRNTIDLGETVGTGIGCLLVIALVILIILLPSIILWAVWNFVIITIWVTLPALGFWKVFAIWCALSVIGGLFKASVHTKE